MFASLNLSIKDIRYEMGLSQSQFASLTGVGKRSIQSYEQGWRKPSEMVERVILLLLIAHRNGADLLRFRCWEEKECSPHVREGCSAYVTRQGHLCWFLTGTMCEGKPQKSWDDKLRSCLKCSFMRGLLGRTTNLAYVDSGFMGREKKNEDKEGTVSVDCRPVIDRGGTGRFCP